MAGFQTHVTVSTAVGVGYGAAAHVLLGMPVPTCVLAGGLCGVAGMLPDLDSNTGRPIRESTAFAAAVVPMLMIDRFDAIGMTRESIVLAGALIYIIIRFGFGEILKRYTVHRGMWHSVPAVFIAGLVAFLVCSCEDLGIRLFTAGGVALGYATHLVLDEVFSVKITPIGPKLKKSFGTALKFWGPSLWGNVSTYGKLILVVVLALGDPLLMEWSGYHQTDHFADAREKIAEYLQLDDTARR